MILCVFISSGNRAKKHSPQVFYESRTREKGESFSQRPGMPRLLFGNKRLRAAETASYKEKKTFCVIGFASFEGSGRFIKSFKCEFA